MGWGAVCDEIRERGRDEASKIKGKKKNEKKNEEGKKKIRSQYIPRKSVHNANRTQSNRIAQRTLTQLHESHHAGHTQADDQEQQNIKQLKKHKKEIDPN